MVARDAGHGGGVREKVMQTAVNNKLSYTEAT